MANTVDNLTLALHVKGASAVTSALRSVASQSTALVSATRAIGVGIGVASGAITALGVAALKAAADEEVLAAKMKAIFGATAGEDALRWAETLSMGIGAAVGDADDLAASMMRLRTLGLNPAQLMEPMINASAATGASMETLAQLFGKIQQQGGLTSRVVLGFISAGIPIADILQKKLGITVEQLRGMGREGIPAAKAIPAIAAGMQALWANAANEQVNTVKGTLARIRNTFSETMDTIGASIWPMIKPWLDNIQQWFADPKNMDTIFQWVAKIIAGFRLAGDAINNVLTQLFTDRGIPKWLGNLEIEMLNLIGYATTFYATMQAAKTGAELGGGKGALIGAGIGFVAGSAVHMTAIDRAIAGVRDRMDRYDGKQLGSNFKTAYKDYETSTLDQLRKNRPGLTTPGVPKGLGPAASQMAQVVQSVSNGIAKGVEAVIIGGAARARGAVKAMDIGIGPGRSRPRVDIYWHSGKGGDIDAAVQRKAEDVTKQAIIQLIRQGWGPKAATAR